MEANDQPVEDAKSKLFRLLRYIPQQEDCSLSRVLMWRITPAVVFKAEVHSGLGKCFNV
jgi:hypothetical protein